MAPGARPKAAPTCYTPPTQETPLLAARARERGQLCRDQWCHDEAELVAAQEWVQSALLRSRGRSCRQTMQWSAQVPAHAKQFKFHNNMGDWLNIDFGSALLGKTGRWTNQRQLLGDALPGLNVAPSLSDYRAKNNPLVLGIGSVIKKVAPGDVIAGAGLKRAAASSSDCTCACYMECGAAQALADQRTTITSLRGPKTREVLGSRGIAAPSTYGDPAVFSTLLVPEFLMLRRKPEGAKKVLCVVPHAFDRLLISQALADMCGGLSNRVTKKGKALNRAKGELYTKSCACGSHAIWLLPVATRPLMIMKDFQECSLVASTALHGIILADALQVPAVWLGQHDASRANKTQSMEQQALKRDPPWRFRKLPDGGNESLPRSVWGQQALRWNVTAQQTAFKYEDYFAGIGKPPARALNFQDVISRMQNGAEAPRLSVAEQLTHAKHFIGSFPFDQVCANVSSRRRAWQRIRSPAEQQLPTPQSCGCSAQGRHLGASLRGA
jgi:hypothetical protein